MRAGISATIPWGSPSTYRSQSESSVAAPRARDPPSTTEETTLLPWRASQTAVTTAGAPALLTGRDSRTRYQPPFVLEGRGVRIEWQHERDGHVCYGAKLPRATNDPLAACIKRLQANSSSATHSAPAQASARSSAARSVGSPCAGSTSSTG